MHFEGGFLDGRTGSRRQSDEGGTMDFYLESSIAQVVLERHHIGVKSVGELILLSQVSIPHKKFIIAFLSHRPGASLPIKLDFSFRMRMYKVLLTLNRGIFPTFQWELGCYKLPDFKVEGSSG